MKTLFLKIFLKFWESNLTHGLTNRDGPSVFWAVAAVDGHTVKTVKAKLINMLKIDDNFEKQSLSLSALLQQ